MLSQTSQQGGAVLRLQRELQQALRAAGYIESKNLAIEWRYSDLDTARLKSHAEELVRLKVDLILTVNTTATHAAQKASATVPIVMINSADPVHSGFAQSLGRPGGNITSVARRCSLLARAGSRLGWPYCNVKQRTPYNVNILFSL